MYSKIYQQDHGNATFACDRSKRAGGR